MIHLESRGEPILATISARVDDRVKAEAERIFDSLGIPLSTAICVFLKKAIAEGGFPFPVVLSKEEKAPLPFTPEEIDAAVKKAIADPDNPGAAPSFTLLDSETNQFVTVQNPISKEI